MPAAAITAPRSAAIVAPDSTARQMKNATATSDTAAIAAIASHCSRGLPARNRAAGFACATASEQRLHEGAVFGVLPAGVDHAAPADRGELHRRPVGELQAGLVGALAHAAGLVGEPHLLDPGERDLALLAPGVDAQAIADEPIGDLEADRPRVLAIAERQLGRHQRTSSRMAPSMPSIVSGNMRSPKSRRRRPIDWV